MKNLLLALLGTTMLSAASAQAPASEWLFELDTDCNGTTQVYEAVVVNAGTNNINAQLTAPDGSTKNFHANIQQGTATLEGQDVCGCVTTPETGHPTGGVTHCIGETGTTTLACEGSALNVNGTILPIVQVVEQENDNVIVLVTDTGMEYLFFRENSCFYTFDFACLSEDTNTFVFINGQGTITVSEELWSCLDLPCVCPEDLSAEYAACQAANAQLSAVVSSQGAVIVDLEDENLELGNEISDLYSAQDSLQALLDQANAVIANLATENEDLATDLYECQSDLNTTEGQLDNCQDMYAAYELYTAGVLGDLLAAENALTGCEAVNDSLLNDLADLTVDLANMTAEADTCFDEYSALDDQFIAAVEDYEDIIDNLNAQLDDLAASSVAVIESLQGQLDDCNATSDNLAAQLNDCETAGIAIVSELQNQLLACQGDLADAQEAASACSAAIETAADNAYAQGLEDCADSCNETCLELLDEAYNAGVVDGVLYFEDEQLPMLLEAEWNIGYNAGYQDGLADCEGTVSGLVDIDGTIVPVIGYYNELGQTINPNTTDGVIIRRHADGTFSKYIKSLR